MESGNEERTSRRIIRKSKVKKRQGGILRFIKRLIVLLLLVFIVCLVVIQLGLSSRIVQDHLLALVSESLHRPITCSRITFSLFRGFTLENVTIREREGFTGDNAGRVESVLVHYRFRGLFRGRIEIDEVRIIEPEFWLRQNAAGEWNWDDLSSSDTTSDDGEDSGSPLPFLVRIESVSISSCGIVIQSLAVKNAHIAGLDLLLTGFEYPGLRGEITLSTGLSEITVDVNDFHLSCRPRLTIVALLEGLTIPGAIVTVGPTFLDVTKGSRNALLPFTMKMTAAADFTTEDMYLESAALDIGRWSGVTCGGVIHGFDDAMQGRIDISRAIFDAVDIQSLVKLIAPIDMDGRLTIEPSSIDLKGTAVASALRFHCVLPDLIVLEENLISTGLDVSGSLSFDSRFFSQIELGGTCDRITYEDHEFKDLQIEGWTMTDSSFSPQTMQVTAKVDRYQGTNLAMEIDYDESRQDGAPLQFTAAAVCPDLAAFMNSPLRGKASLAVSGKGSSLRDVDVSMTLKSPDLYYLVDYSTSAMQPFTVNIQMSGDVQEGNLPTVQLFAKSGADLSIKADGELTGWGKESASFPKIEMSMNAGSLCAALPSEILSLDRRQLSGTVTATGFFGGSFENPHLDLSTGLKEIGFSDPEGLSIGSLNGSVHVVYGDEKNIEGQFTIKDFRVDPIMAGESLDVRLNMDNRKDGGFKLSGRSTVRASKIRFGGANSIDFRLLLTQSLDLDARSLALQDIRCDLRDIGTLTGSIDFLSWGETLKGSVASADINLKTLSDALPMKVLGMEGVILDGHATLSASMTEQQYSADLTLKELNLTDDAMGVSVNGLAGSIKGIGTASTVRLDSTLNAARVMVRELRSLPYQDVSLDLSGTLLGSERLELKTCRLGLEGDTLVTSVTGELTASRGRYRPGLQAKLTLVPQAGFQPVEGITVGGYWNVNAAIDGNREGMTVEGTMVLKDVIVSALPAFEIRGVNGTIPFWHGNRDLTSRNNRDQQEQLARLQQLLPSLFNAGETNTVIEQVIFGNYVLDRVDANVLYRQGKLQIDELRCLLLDGKITGNAMIDLNHPGIHYVLSANMTNVNFGLFSRKRLMSFSRTAPLNSYLAISGIGTDVQGDYNITRVSLATIDNLLLSFDPEEVSPDIVTIRNYLKTARKLLIVHPHSMTFRIQNDNVNITILLLPLGIQFKTKVPLSIIWQSLGVEE